MISLTFLRNVCFYRNKTVLPIAISFIRIQNPSYSTKMKMLKPSFNIDDYDCVGFDLDNTLCEYKVDALVQMEYEVMAQHLISKGYSESIVAAPFGAKELNFMQRGLLLDFKRGNILKLNNLGEVSKASHGSRTLSEKDILNVYGEGRKCEITNEFINDMTVAWEPSVQCKFRAVLDFFDMPASLAFARAVDDMEKRSKNNYLECGIDVLAALQEMYSREHFHTEQGNFYKYLKREPDVYINKCPDGVINWLRELNKSKIVFLITGSNVDLCHFTASNCLGKNWRDLFDIVICFARKPGFFKSKRPFFATNEFKEMGPIERPEMGSILSQGNWQQLNNLLAKTVGKPNPTCLYFGDNLVEDVYAATKWGSCDVVAVVEDIFFKSDYWGPYATLDTFWGNIIQSYTLTYVPSLKVLAAHPFKEGVPFLVEQEGEMDMSKK